MNVVDLPQTGGCLCGALRYELSGAPLLAYACHCHDCQTRSGAAFSLTLVVRTAEVAFSGPVEIIHRPTLSGRDVDHGVCPACRTPLSARARIAPDFMSLRAGTLDDATWVVPGAQTFVESAIPWALIDGVPSVPWTDFDFAALGVAWRKTAPRFVRA